LGGEGSRERKRKRESRREEICTGNIYWVKLPVYAPVAYATNSRSATKTEPIACVW
jgi:hypothetical protein